MKNRIKELEKLISQYKRLYYSGHPEVEDHVYDKLEDELRSLDPDNLELKRVGSQPSSLSKVQHDKKMLSLEKTYVEDDLFSWVEKRPVVSTYKIDGMSCSLLYREGDFVLAKTRGDGSYGEDITLKARWIESIPFGLNDIGHDFEVRGEIYCREKDFFHLGQEMERRGLEAPSSQRNIVAGLISRKDHIDLARFLEFQAFDLIEEGDFQTEMDKFHLLHQRGFLIPDVEIHKDKKSVQKRLEEAKEFMAEGDYLIDGIVFTFNDLKLHQQLGETSHHPRYKIAFKFQGDSKITTLEKIEWSVSRNGNLTPVGHVTSVELSGAKISRVTLHNFGLVRQYSLKSGDKIEIIRSGEVIPKFLSLKNSSQNEFDYPKVCPSCGHKTFVEDIRLLCKNLTCPSRVKESLLYFIKKMGMDNLSGKRLDELILKLNVTSISDLYDLTYEDFLKLDKVKDKLALKLYSAIDSTRETDLLTFLSALGISGGAYNKCEKIVLAGHDTLEKIMMLDISTLCKVDGFAKKSAEEFLLSLESKREMISILLKKGLHVLSAEKKETPFSGKKICITGSLTEKRSVIEENLRKLGAIIVGSVTKNTDYLLTNETESSSSKFKKAEELGVPKISEEKLKEMVSL